MWQQCVNLTFVDRKWFFLAQLLLMYLKVLVGISLAVVTAIIIINNINNQ